jgi:hypothetical protein
MAGLGCLSTIALSTELHLGSNAEQASDWNFTQQAELGTYHSAVLGHWKLTLVWAWIFFALNTMMTTSIIYKILSVISFRSHFFH